VPTTILATKLAVHIQKLVDKRQHHAEALAHLDQMLAGVGAALTGNAAPAKAAPARRGRPPLASAPAPVKGRKKRRKVGKYATSAEESLLAFVSQHKNPATKELKKHYFSEGRGGTVDNVLSKLVREKKLKREPLKGERGSRYLMP